MCLEESCPDSVPDHTRQSGSNAKPRKVDPKSQVKSERLLVVIGSRFERPAYRGGAPVWVWIGFTVIVGIAAIGFYGFADPEFLGATIVQWAAGAILILGICAWVYMWRRGGRPVPTH